MQPTNAGGASPPASGGGQLSAETFSTAVVIPAWLLAIALWIYSIWCFGRALKHPAPGIEAWRAWLWRNSDLSSEGLKFRRRGSRAMLGFVAVVLGVFALAWFFGIAAAKANPVTERPSESFAAD